MRRSHGRLFGQGEEKLIGDVRAVARPLDGVHDLDPLLERIGDARYVLLGEASHGTSDYYTWRARISQRLILEKGFSFIAVEGDWPDCYRVNRYVKGYRKDDRDLGASAREVLGAFDHWPTWMWANWETVALSEWLRGHNDGLPEERKVGFYGLDVYSLWESMETVRSYLEREQPDMVEAAERAYRCFEPYREDAHAYAQATAFVPTSCEDEVIHLLRELRSKPPQYHAQYEGDRETAFNTEQNALVMVNAERYYRAMIRGSAESWNVRDRHMADTLDRLMALHGPEAKAIVWEHNTHIGDARATDMAEDGMVNVGQLVRERHEGEGVVLVGFGSYRGGVIAGKSWGAKMERMPVPEAREGSWEEVFHRALGGDGLLLLPGAASADLLNPRGHRAIGVVYNPAYERHGNYVPTVLPRRYDAFLYLDETAALHPLQLAPTDTREPPETYSWGV